jgi:DNA-directed RNA polymerase III subunit RPC8
MFVISTYADTIRIMPHMFHQSTQSCVHHEIDKKYPNRVIMDVGLVICRYGAVTQIGDGVCVPGDGAAHHEVIFRLIVFRPFVEEVLVGHITSCNEEGIMVQLGGFFYDIFIPAYWMLRPTEFDRSKGLWVWMPQYEPDEPPERYEMDIGAEIRFKVKGINFTQITNTAKGVQATMSSTTSRHLPTGATTDHHRPPTDYGGGSGSTAGLGNHNASSSSVDLTGSKNENDYRPVRKRSSSFDTTEISHPECMTITGSICEDGLGLVSWWANGDEQEENDDDDDDDEVLDDEEDMNHVEVLEEVLEE